MLILSRDDMRRALDAAELFEALADGFRGLAEGQWKIPLRVAIEMPAHQGVSLFMPAYGQGLAAAGMKLVTVMHGNPAKNLPLLHSKYLYVSAETGEILSLMDGEFLTALRTATVSALVTDLVGKSGGRTMAVFGTGAQAWYHVEVFAKLFSIGEVLVFGQTPELGEQFAERVERQLRKPSRRAILNELKRADIICTCTTNPAPLFELKDLSSAVHINAIGAYRPTTREIGSDVMARAIIVVDSYESAFNEAGELVIPLNQGVIGRNHVYASIDELVSGGKPAPDADNRITVFKSVGMALEDLVAADLAYRRAVEGGIGTNVPG
ncbi:MAG TPA: ornithine cyclodeaminase family protein [Terriglobia bacterium]|nr:ornithine cyclodeaminase family protein [Terriglobia bacterium]